MEDGSDQFRGGGGLHRNNIGWVWAQYRYTIYMCVCVRACAIYHLVWWSPTEVWLSKVSAICDFGQPFHIANIFCSRMIDQNYEMTNIFVSHFWVGDHHPGWRIHLPYIYVQYICIEPRLNLCCFCVDPPEWPVGPHTHPHRDLGPQPTPPHVPPCTWTGPSGPTYL
jgi:hypothetical protein